MKLFKERNENSIRNDTNVCDTFCWYGYQATIGYGANSRSIQVNYSYNFYTSYRLIYVISRFLSLAYLDCSASYHLIQFNPSMNIEFLNFSFSSL